MSGPGKLKAPPLILPLAAGAAEPVTPSQGLTIARVSPSSTSTAAIAGDGIGRLLMSSFAFPRLVGSSTDTTAKIGDPIGTIRV